MGLRIALISCVSQKREGKHKARDLYVSDLFKKSFAYTSRNFDRVFILSAKYGLLNPDDLIESYNSTLNRFPEAKKKRWAAWVRSQLQKRINPDDTIYWFAGNNYRKYLKSMLPNDQHEPLKGLAIGKQLAWYKKHLQ